LTTQERALIQTFPTSFQLPGCKSDVEQVIGNAVPVKLAEYLASRLRDHVQALDARDELLAPCQLFERKAAVVA
jgi:DNA (cytosine-5)-methyltransferase 1